MRTLPNAELCADEILSRIGKRVSIATPLGIGKPNHLLNALYRRAKRDRSIELSIHTGLTLQKPRAKNELEQRMLGPLVERVFGDYPDLEYELDRAAQRLPENVRVIEFYVTAGKFLHNPVAQQDYIASNYTHVARDLLARGVNVVVQQVCAGVVRGRPRLSLSCNPDLSVDLLHGLRARAKHGGAPFVTAAQINDKLPFMYGDAEVDPEVFDFVVDDPAGSFTLFAPPKQAVDPTEAIIGLYASTLVRDGGELQVGIGALGDAVTYALELRQEDNARYQQVLRQLGVFERFGGLIESTGDTEPFERGLFAASEMLVDGFMHLFQAGILKRRVYDDLTLSRLLNSGRIDENVTPEFLDLLRAHKGIHAVLTDADLGYLQHFGILSPNLRFADDKVWLPDGRSFVPDLSDPAFREALLPHYGRRLEQGAVIHAGFFLGPGEFYDWLRALSEAERRLISMRSVTKINQLYGHEELDRLHRRDARFINTTMKVTLLGATSSDALEDGRVVSGVGGQYNFVAMAHELPGGRSVIQLRSTREHDGHVSSNIVWSYGNTTGPRHLRDIFITEYGIADLRAKTDQECVQAMLQIADSRFQPELMQAAKHAGKLAQDYVIPSMHRHNRPEAFLKPMAAWRSEGLFPDYPFGTDLTQEEQALARALRKLQASLQDPRTLLQTAMRAVRLGDATPELEPLLRRMGLDAPHTPKDHLYRRLLIAALRS
ncbi:MAG TPA: acetyl-CoA hydrolase/transferase C-terminal domain-containing protein [Polyangiales bacterium]|nr:acetyl-CoA hydrolase/transferase C-terminal domain-containing protein [Polyangiales bacterium]